MKDEAEAAEDDEDEKYHTKESDMWAFGMVIYVCTPYLLVIAFAN